MEEITEEQQGQSGPRVAADRVRESSNSEESRPIKTVVARDARAGRVLKKLEGAFDMVYKMLLNWETRWRLPQDTRAALV